MFGWKKAEDVEGPHERTTETTKAARKWGTEMKRLEFESKSSLNVNDAEAMEILRKGQTLPLVSAYRIPPATVF